ncbi:type II toxin-antitoxin system RelE/ParE family toxin [Bradyrhizobium diazoefficiens]|uniref:type II toxin-antitoxin system RelE/ParE family toxin n=1 Tax=Bradyrhizobium diazoefficiens TaxID=1355477 RepID=UPI00190DC900|nr:type II toxin-antitoxin system RelE/ParE family toxin [Bradyrhizobium diazoefficiens]QQO36796.1 type II toxin-antitoxin system RelE/ParE family toxin [Bradyrhizobium diazoefficiens]
MGQARAVKVRYTKRALAQIDEALTYINARSPQGATHVRDRIVALIALLEDRPYAGRQTTRAYVRRLPVNPYPYLIDYRVTSTEIVIMRFRHAARRPPRTR